MGWFAKLFGPLRAEPVSMVCAFCAKPKEQVRKLIAGPGVSICSDCARLFHERPHPAPADPAASCRFCAMAGTQATRLIAGPGLNICAECVGLCVEILNEDPDVATAKG